MGYINICCQAKHMPKIITTDCGNLYNTALSILDNSLYSDTNISEKLIEKIDLLNLDIQKEQTDKECKKFGSY